VRFPHDVLAATCPHVPEPQLVTQLPVQASLQQTPPAQKPLAHWLGVVQAPPFGRLTHV
jgi:hypothetical protein